MIVGHIGGSSSGGYEIQKSLRFRANASAYLSKAVVTGGDTQKWTYSLWIKRGLLGSGAMVLLEAGPSSGERSTFVFSNDAVVFESYDSNVKKSRHVTNRLFRDPSAFLHLVLTYNANSVVAADRVKIYVNGTRETSFVEATLPALNQNTYISNSVTGGTHTVGKSSYAAAAYLDGYLSEINFIDGQALDPTYFGQVSAETGAWIPKKYTGTYGTNGFYLPFNDGSTLANLAADRSGSGNNWACNNISLTPGATYDWMDDTPTNNFAVLNPLSVNAVTLSQGNLYATGNAVQCGAAGTMVLPSGKWYCEFIRADSTAAISTDHFGVINENPTTGQLATTANSDSLIYRNDGAIFRNTGSGFSQIATVASYAQNDIIGVAVNIGANTVQFYKNGVAQGIDYSITSGVNYMPWVTFGTSGGLAIANFGQRPFAYSPPVGFKALCTKNLPTPSILNPKKHFDATTWVGNQSARTITNGGNFQPDLVWTKSRSDAESHRLHDSVRGGNGTVLYELNSNLTEPDGTDTLVSGVVSNGFTIASGTNSPNITGRTYASWQWKAGGAPVTNNAGSIQSQVSANPQAGFSIVTYTGTGANATVGHGLGVAPKFVIVKRRGTTGYAWICWHTGLPSGAYYIYLSTTGAQASDATVWNSTIPTSSVFSLGTNAYSNAADTYVAYCFSEIPGFSKIGSYTGNWSADGPFVYCGFRPKFVMIKRTDAASNWIIKDSARSLYNVGLETLYPNLANAEGAGESWDATANGIKLRSTSTEFNANGGSYIFYAVAEQPFQFANAR